MTNKTFHKTKNICIFDFITQKGNLRLNLDRFY